jgi:hypothetical protein
MKPGIDCVRTHWIRGFMAFHWVRRVRIVMLMVPTCPESGFLGMPPAQAEFAPARRPTGPLADRGYWCWWC